MRVPRGLVQVEIDRHHEVEPAERPLEPRAVRSREHRVAGEADEAAHLTRAGRLHLLGHRHRGQRAEKFRQPAHPRAPASVVVADQAPPERRDVGGRLRKHDAAFTIEVAADEVERFDQPVGDRAELVLTGADAAVDGGARRRSELVGQPTDDLGREADRGRHALRREPRGDRRQLLAPGRDLVDGARVDEAVGVQHVQEREQERRVAAGPHEVVLVAPRRGLAPPGIDEHQPAAARADALQAAPHVAERHHAAVRRRRVGAEHQQEVRPIDVDDRHRQRVAVDLHAGEQPRVRILRVGIEAVARAQRQR